MKWRIVGTAALAVIALTTMGAASCSTVGGGSTVNQPSSPGPSSSSTGAPAAVAHVGATLTLNGSSGEQVQVTLVKMVDPSTPASQYAPLAAGMRSVAVELRYKNVGSNTYNQSVYTDLTVLDAASHAYSVAITGDTTAGPGFPSDVVNIGPGESADGFVAFQIPKATPVTEVKLSAGFLASTLGGDTGEWLVP